MSLVTPEGSMWARKDPHSGDSWTPNTLEGSKSGAVAGMSGRKMLPKMLGSARVSGWVSEWKRTSPAN